MTIDCKKTIELTDIEIEQFCQSYKKTLGSSEKTVETFKNEYLHSALGYSFHVLLKNEEGTVVGGYSAIPFYYYIKGEKKIVAPGADFMIEKEYRNDIRNVIGLIKNTESFLRANGVVCLYAIPNEYSYALNIRLMRMKPIATLDMFVLPRKVGGLKPALKWLNPLSVLFCKILLWLSNLYCGKKEHDVSIYRVRPDFEEYRYKWHKPEDYRIYKDKDVMCAWKLSEVRGIKACFLMDVYPYSSYAFAKAVREMVRNEKKNADAFIFVGNMPVPQCSMIKIPQKLQPKEFKFVGKVIDREQFTDEQMLNVRDWDVNVSSFDFM